MQGPTPSQTVGPYFSIGLKGHYCDNLIATDHRGNVIVVSGKVLDGNGEPVPDAVIEIWQADEKGLYPEHTNQPKFRGWGRISTDGDGAFSFRTLRPGQVVGSSGHSQAPHINVVVFMRGLLRHLFTRIYFEGEAANKSDQVLSHVPEQRRNTLLARPLGDHLNYRWDIVLQGENETVFLQW